MALLDPIKGESLLQYALRVGMSPNDASAMLAHVAQSNMGSGGLSGYGGAVQGAIDRSRKPGTTHQGFNLADPNSPYYVPPIGLNPSGAQGGWVGQTWYDVLPNPDGTGGVVGGGAPPGTTPGAGGGGGGGTAPGGGGTTPGGGGGGGQPVIPNPYPDPLLPPSPTLPVTPGTGGGGGGAPGGGYVPGSGQIPPQYGAAGERSPYAAINLLLPGYGITQNLEGFGIPGVDTGKVQRAGGSWAGTGFAGPGPATGGTQFDPTYDPYSVYLARQAAAAQGGGGGGTQGSTGTTQVANVNGREIYLNPSVNSQGQPAPPGMVWVPNGGDGGGESLAVNLNDPYWGSSGATQPTGVPTTSGASGTSSIPGWGIQEAIPWLTTSYLQSYGGKPAPFANIHEQIGNAMQGHPAALPAFQWNIPEEMFAAQPGATGMPPGGWTQMLGYTPGAPSNYGFVGGRANPYGPGAGAVGINPAIG